MNPLNEKKAKIQIVCVMRYLLLSCFLQSDLGFALSKDNCNYYLETELLRKCVESNAKEETRYLTHWGYVFCRKFENRKESSNSSQKLKTWISNTTLCLQESIKRSRDKSCKDIETNAIDDHIDCYRNSGFCSLSPNDIAQLFKTLFSVDIIDREKLPRSIFDGIELIKCNLVDKMKYIFVFAIDIFQSFGKWTSNKARKTVKDLILNIPESKPEFDRYMVKAISAYFSGNSASSQSELFSKLNKYDFNMSMNQFLTKEKLSNVQSKQV